MTQDQFDNVTEELFKLRSKIVQQKRPEYTEGNTDVLFNFKATAVEIGVRPEQVCYIFLRKHLASLATFCKTDLPTSEPIMERIADAMNYLELLNAIILEPKQ